MGADEPFGRELNKGEEAVVVQWRSHVRKDFATPWTAEPQASLSLTISWNLPEFMSIELVMVGCFHFEGMMNQAAVNIQA